ncbi:uncharacterized protein LOC133295483 [Gastrolobium bilobum]|uniref:uncharacterized protein LOC133295483 n=1 Tax=Gastrolobium bilobum TaxID=150636 RepID=UPI002AB00776|nr:uncharacterized protein LOC133295483 [Gastrolobium bilobum]
MAITVEHTRYDNRIIYTVDFHGNEINVTVTAKASVVRKWLSTTLFFRRRDLFENRFVVGLGVQWTPGGRELPDPPADTLQLCVGSRCLIFRLRVPLILRKFLLNPNHTFVGFWNSLDRNKLESSEHRLRMYEDPIDLRRHVGEDLRQASVRDIVEDVLGYEVERGTEISRSNWGKVILSHKQVRYATVDAYCAFLIGKLIRA